MLCCIVKRFEWPLVRKALDKCSPFRIELTAGSEEDVPLPETEEIELVERALKEALRIRSGSASSNGPRCSRGPPRPSKEPGDTAAVKPSEANPLG